MKSAALPRTLIMVLFVTWFGLLAAPAAATAPEYSIKAAYLYKFASFIEWPEGIFSRADSPLVIGVIGDDEMSDELGRIVVGQQVNGHPLQTRALHAGDALTGVNILFIGNVDNELLAKTLAEAREHAVLTVTGSEERYAQGSMVNLLVVENRVRFEVALEPVEAAHLRISARMLSAALNVSRGSR